MARRKSKAAKTHRSVRNKKTKKSKSSSKKSCEILVKNNESSEVSVKNHESSEVPVKNHESSEVPVKNNENVGVSQGTKKALDEIKSLCEGLTEPENIPDTRTDNVEHQSHSNNDEQSDDQHSDYDEFLANIEKGHKKLMETFEADRLDFVNTAGSLAKEQVKYLVEQQELGQVSSKNTVAMFNSAMKFMDAYHTEMAKAMLAAKKSYNKLQNSEQEFIANTENLLKEVEKLEGEIHS